MRTQAFVVPLVMVAVIGGSVVTNKHSFHHWLPALIGIPLLIASVVFDEYKSEINDWTKKMLNKKCMNEDCPCPEHSEHHEIDRAFRAGLMYGSIIGGLAGAAIGAAIFSAFLSFVK